MEKNNKTALIFGIAGQDGSFMAELLYGKGYNVCGVVREINNNNTYKWIEKGIYQIFELKELNEIENLISTIKPDEIYNFAGVSNVFNPFQDTDKIHWLNAQLPQMIMESIISQDKNIKYFQASSCLIFGRDNSGFQNECTPINPLYPYGASKLYADNMLREYRENYNKFFCSGIFFPHESERRGDGFFTKKVVKGAIDVLQGKIKKMKVGDLNQWRDWGYAKDYMEAAYLMMQSKEPKDYVIGTGQKITTGMFVEESFKQIGLDYLDYIDVDASLVRKNDINVLVADTTLIKKDLGWQPQHNIYDLIKIMIDHEKRNN